MGTSAVEPALLGGAGGVCGRWWFLLDREVVEAADFLEGAKGWREVGVVAAKEGVG